MTSQPTTDQPTNQATNQPTSDPPIGLTLEEAAAQLGISREAVRLRVRRGTLPGERVDGQWIVYAVGRSDVATNGHGQPTDRPGDRPGDRPDRPARARRSVDHSAEVHRLEQLVAALERERTELREDLDARRREVQELHVLLGRAQGLALGPGEPAPAPRRPWWRRVLHL